MLSPDGAAIANGKDAFSARHVLFTGKPLAVKCLSCEKGIKDMSPAPGDPISWDALPKTENGAKRLYSRESFRRENSRSRLGGGNLVEYVSIRNDSPTNAGRPSTSSPSGSRKK
jgi:hypothetical protein